MPLLSAYLTCAFALSGLSHPALSQPQNLVHKDPVTIMKIHREAVLRMKQGLTLDDVFEVRP